MSDGLKFKAVTFLLSCRFLITFDLKACCRENWQWVCIVIWMPDIKDVPTVMMLLSSFSRKGGWRTDARTYVCTDSHVTTKTFWHVWGSARAPSAHGSSCNVSHKWFDTLWEDNRTNNRNNAASPKKITTANKQINNKLTRAATLMIKSDESKKVQSSLSNTTEIHPYVLFVIGCLNNWIGFIKSQSIYPEGGGGV